MTTMTIKSLKNTVIIEGLTTSRFDSNLTLIASYGDTKVYSVSGMTAKALIATMTTEDATGEFGLMTDTQLDAMNLIAEASEPVAYTLDQDIYAVRVSDDLYLVDSAKGYRWAASL